MHIPLSSSPVPGLPQLCGWQGGVAATGSSLGLTAKADLRGSCGQFVLPKGDEVTGRCFSMLTELHTFFLQRAWKQLVDALMWY